MNLDFFILGLVAFFGVLGFFSGFARQMAQAIAGLAAVAAATPAGRFFAEPVAQGLQSSLTVGVIVGTLLSFVVIYLVLQAVLRALILRVLAGKDSKRKIADRFLGLGLAVLKSAALVWFALSGITFIENNLVLAGKKYVLAPKGSLAVKWAKEHNLFEMLQFSAARDFLKAAQLATDSRAAAKLKHNEDFGALMRDSRFHGLLESEALKKALQENDVSQIMTDNRLVELLHDPAMGRHLERLAQMQP